MSCYGKIDSFPIQNDPQQGMLQRNIFQLSFRIYYEDDKIRPGKAEI
jgi:hypothetical protein